MTAVVLESFKAFIVCAIGVALFSLLLRAPKRALIPAALLSGLGFLLYRSALLLGAPELLSYFIGAVAISSGAEWLARRIKMPVLIFLFPGIVPLVPGLGLYTTMLHLIRRDYELFIQTGAQTFFIAGVIVVSVVLTGTAARQISAFLQKRRSTKSGI